MDWLDTGIGRNLQLEERRRVQIALDSVFGDQFLQIGQWGEGSYASFSRTRRAAVVDDRPDDPVDFLSALDAIAVVDDTIDVAVLPHVLETHDNPHGVLREVDRILRADGHIIILGFNPVCWWGVKHVLSRRRVPVGIQRMISERRLRDWLNLLNFSVRHASVRYFQSPVARCYMLVARKELYTVTPIKPVWKRPRRLVGRLVNPTTRNAA
jgi:SAM-dependent methyltransferase